MISFPFPKCIRPLKGMVNRFLLPWAAYFGLFAGTSNCPCCGQPVCPAGVAGMGILAGLVAAVTGFFRRQRVSPQKADATPTATDT